MKNVKFRGKKTNFAGKIPRQKPKKFRGPRKTVGPIYESVNFVCMCDRICVCVCVCV